jgi:hypothetical protein
LPPSARALPGFVTSATKFARWLVVVDAPWCCAGAVTDGDRLYQCAPILRAWFLRSRTPRDAVVALRRAGAKVSFLPVPD